MNDDLLGRVVQKTGGDYRFQGIVRAVFRKGSGAVRLVVENSDGVLFIFSPANLGLPENKE